VEPSAPEGRPADSRRRVLARRLVVALVVVAQLALVVRGYRSDHKELAFQMFPESSTWRAEIVRVEANGTRVSIADDWMGYRWSDLVEGRGLDRPEVRRHADAGLDNQLAFLDAALDWAAAHTPRDDRTVYLEATVTVWHNTDPAEVVVLRSRERDVAR
jgi:hypothetical protein